MFSSAAPERDIQITLYTDSYRTHGTLRTRQRRVSDLLNLAEEPFLLVQDALIEEYGLRGDTFKATYAQVNLATVLFAVTDEAAEGSPELRTPKTQQQAIVTVPPFKLVGYVHLMPHQELGAALEMLDSRFIPLTEVVYWSDTIGEARTASPMVVFNHARAQILAPHQTVDPWAGLDKPGAASDVPGSAAETTDAGGDWR